MTIEIVDFPMKNGGSFHSYVSLPDGTTKGYNLALAMGNQGNKWK